MATNETTHTAVEGDMGWLIVVPHMPSRGELKQRWRRRLHAGNTSGPLARSEWGSGPGMSGAVWLGSWSEWAVGDVLTRSPDGSEKSILNQAHISFMFSIPLAR